MNTLGWRCSQPSLTSRGPVKVSIDARQNSVESRLATSRLLFVLKILDSLDQRLLSLEETQHLSIRYSQIVNTGY